MKLMHKLRHLLLIICHLLFAAPLVAQDVVVNVMPVQEILPPQVMVYLSDPDRYFTITLSNQSIEEKKVYLGLELEQIVPSTGLRVATPTNRQPERPFVIPAGGVYTLNVADMKHLFDHIPSNEMIAPPGLFEDFNRGRFGLLPEGTYQATVTAYRWDPAIKTPQPVSNPATGTSLFRVCYKAQAPTILQPQTTILGDDMSLAKLDRSFPLFTWTAPTVQCAGAKSHPYRYTLRIVEMLPGQQPDQAIDFAPQVYYKDNLTSTQLLVPTTVTMNLRTDVDYLVQVTATSTNTNANLLDYVMIENQGKSMYRRFRFIVPETPGASAHEEEEKAKEKEEEEAKKEAGLDDHSLIMGETSFNDSISTDSLYTFRNPVLLEPVFAEGGMRTHYIYDDLPVKFRKSIHMGGDGLQSDTIKFSYTVELFNGKNNVDIQAAFDTKPIYSRNITKPTKGSSVQYCDTIPWDDIKEQVLPGDYMVLRIRPVVTHGRSVAFAGDQNVIDFTFIDHVARTYFQCSNMVDIDNTEPTSKSIKELKSSVVGLGQYDLTINSLEKRGDGKGYDGDGWIEWKPFGKSVMIAVKFDSLQINTDNIVYGGIARTYPDKTKITSTDIINKVFTDWGIDNFIASSGLPYAEQISGIGKSQLESVINQQGAISKYYGDIKKGLAVKDWLSGGNPKVHLPLAIPSALKNYTPVDIQISQMTFAPRWAMMDLIGEFQIPESSYTDNSVLMFGAPRLCISPDRVLPESGTLALLGDFTINDPKSDFQIKFKAPEDFLEPTNGCYVAWHADEFEIFGFDVDMRLPELVKDVNGEPSPTHERPILNVIASMGKADDVDTDANKRDYSSLSDDERRTTVWNDWMIDRINIDPFQVEDMPGYTFTASEIIYDHSVYRNARTMGNFPQGYDTSWIGGTTQKWMGLYIGEIGIKFPKALQIGTTGDKRLAMSGRQIFIDDSGVSFDLGVDNIFSAKTGKLGGWSFSLDRASMLVVQSDFRKVNFKGTFDVPLVDSDFAYTCNIYNQKQVGKEGYSYIFTTQQVKDQAAIDLFLADVTFDKGQTYLVVESEPGAGGSQETRVEFLMSGKLGIGHTTKKSLQDKLNKLPLKIDIPDVHFVGMRIANCKKWKSTYKEVLALQNGKLKESFSPLLELVEDSCYVLASNSLYFNRGAWSVASLEKKLGSFTFKINDYKLDFDGKTSDLSLKITGMLGLLDDKISATAGVTLHAGILGLDAVKSFDFSKLGFEFREPSFNKVGLHFDFSGMKLDGTLEINKPTSANPNKGFGGTIGITIPGGLFEAQAAGGFYEHTGSSSSDNYKWGFFYMMMGGEAFNIPPVQLTEIKGGFYFNCYKNTAAKGSITSADFDISKFAIAKKGMIGVEAGLSLSMSGMPEAINGSAELVVAYDTSNKHFTRVLLKGDANVLGTKAKNYKDGLIKASIQLLYANEPDDRYLDLTITADASADVTQAVYQQLSGHMPPAVADAMKNALSEFSSDADEGTGKKNSDAKEPSDKTFTAKAGASLKLNLHVELEMKNATGETYYTKTRNKKDCKWHLYIGEPGTTAANRYDKRCSITFVDFQLNGKDDPIAVWAKLYANAYLCLGNELPNNGQLPPLPETVEKFLNGKDINGNSQSLSTTAYSNRDAAVGKMKIKGGLMFGAEIGGNFGCNAVIAYAEAEAIFGFDLVMKKLEDGSCRNGGKAGKNGWYGSGQVYAYLGGKVGLMLNLWIFKGKIPLVDVGLGAMLQGGFPNPSWFYGKARAKCKLFGGLIKFNQSITIDIGEICLPDAKDPLDDIEMFGDTYPDYDNKSEGWNKDNAISPYELPRFATNMQLNTTLYLVSEDYDNVKDRMTHMRTYRFKMKSIEVRTAKDRNSSLGSRTTVSATSLNNDQENWTVQLGALRPDTCYHIKLIGMAEEYRNNTWGRPYHEKGGELVKMEKDWVQEKEMYFCTGPLPDHLVDQDLYAARPGRRTLNSEPGDENCFKYTKLYKVEGLKPYISLTRNDRWTTITKPSTCDVIARIERRTNNGWHLVDEKPLSRFTQDGGEVWSINHPLSQYDNGIFFDYFTNDSNRGMSTTDIYRYSILRRDRAKYNAFMKEAEEKVRRTTASGKVTTTANSQGDGTSVAGSVSNTLSYSETTYRDYQTAQNASDQANKDLADAKKMYDLASKAYSAASPKDKSKLKPAMSAAKAAYETAQTNATAAADKAASAYKLAQSYQSSTTGDKISLSSIETKITNLEASEESKSFVEEEIKDFAQSNKLPDYMELIYQCEYTLYDYMDINEHLTAQAKSAKDDEKGITISNYLHADYGRQYYTTFNGLTDNVFVAGYIPYSTKISDLFLTKTKLTYTLGKPNVTYSRPYRDNPYVYMMYLQTFVFPKGLSISGYKYGDKVDNLIGLTINLSKVNVPYNYDVKTSALHDVISPACGFLPAFYKAFLDDNYSYFMMDNINSIRPHVSTLNYRIKNTIRGNITFHDMMCDMIRTECNSLQGFTNRLYIMYNKCVTDYLSKGNKPSYWDMTHFILGNEGHTWDANPNYVFQMPFYQIPLCWTLANSDKETNNMIKKASLEPYIKFGGVNTPRYDDSQNMNWYDTWNSITYLNTVKAMHYSICDPIMYITSGTRQGQEYIVNAYNFEIKNPFIKK